LILLLFLADQFDGAKDLGVKKEAGPAIGALPTLLLSDRCSQEEGKGASVK